MKKIYNVMATAAVVASLAVPASAFASSSYTTTTGVTTISANNTITSTTRVAVKIDPGSLTTATSVNLRLPADSSAQISAVVPPTVGSNPNAVASASATQTANSASKAVYGGGTAYQEFTLSVTPSTYTSNDGLVYLDVTNLYVPSTSNGMVNLAIDAQPGSSLTSGNVTLAQVSSGKVDVTVDDTASVTQNGDKIAPIRIKEVQAGSLSDSGNQLKIKLPNGFTWNLPASGTLTTTAATANNLAYFTPVWGDGKYETGTGLAYTVSSDGRSLAITGSGSKTQQASYYSLNGLTVNVDSSVAKTGDIDATLGGDSTLNQSDLVVGTYGQLGATATIGGTPVNEIAGRNADNDLNSGFLTIQENAANSLIDGRTIKLTLGGNAKWDVDYSDPTHPAPVGPKIDQSASDLQGVTGIGTWSWVGTDHTTIEAPVNMSSTKESKPAKIVFKKGDLDVAADAANQDVTLTLGGTQGLTATGTIAKIVSPVKVSVNGDTPNLKIGVQNQALNPIDITEAVSGALDVKGNKNVTLVFPLGVSVHNPQSVSVTSGDLVLADASSISSGTDANGHGTLTFNIKSTSSTASTIEVKGLSVDVNRMVSEGPLNVDVTGDSLNENGSGTTNAAFPNVTKVGSYTVANVVTPAPGETTASAQFTIGKTAYTVNGVQKTLDVAPYTDGGRTYLPIRFVAEALGISDDNIVWNDATKTVTLINGNRIASFKVGQKSDRSHVVL